MILPSIRNKNEWLHRLALIALATAAGCSADKSDDTTHTHNTHDEDSGNDASDTGLIWPAEEWREGEPEAYGMDSDALEELADYAFRPRFNTQSVVVIKDGVLIAEWYAEDTDQDTEVTSWSAAKSITSALIGVGIRDAMLNLDDTVGSYVSDWSNGDNAEVTIRHLLEMRSGMDPNDSNQYGVYGATNQLAYSLDRTVTTEPGQTFQYVNEDSMVLGEVLSQAYGATADEVAKTEIFDIIGMDGNWWTDASGNVLTYCCYDTTARSFARFGLLYSRGGEWDGQQVVPAAYVDESTTGISYYGYYGLHWWTYGEVYAAIGYHGQYIFVNPANDLVVARFGRYTRHGSEYARQGDNYHETYGEGNFDSTEFQSLFLAAVIEP